MKRKSLDELFDDLQISLTKKKKPSELEYEKKQYSQIEVNKLLKEQKEFLFQEFQKYVEIIRNTSECNIPTWTC